MPDEESAAVEPDLVEPDLVEPDLVEPAKEKPKKSKKSAAKKPAEKVAKPAAKEKAPAPVGLQIKAQEKMVAGSEALAVRKAGAIRGPHTG